jgi:hypothetical protein
MKRVAPGDVGRESRQWQAPTIGRRVCGSDERSHPAALQAGSSRHSLSLHQLGRPPVHSPGVTAAPLSWNAGHGARPVSTAVIGYMAGRTPG